MFGSDKEMYPHSSTWHEVMLIDANDNPQLVNYYSNGQKDNLLFQHVFLYDGDGNYKEGGIVNVKAGEMAIEADDAMFGV